MNQVNFDSMRELWFTMSVDDRINFIESNIVISTTKGSYINLKLTKEQKKWFLDGPLFEDYTKKTKFHNRICLKIRNVGASLVMIACESVLACWIYKKVFCPYVSAGEDQANELIVHAKFIIEHCKFQIPLKGELKDQTKAEIQFLNGSRIKSFASNNPRGIRGPRALISYCLPYDQKVITDIGELSIGDVVEKGIGNKVLSYNHETNKCEWKNILKRMKNELGNRKIIRINDSFECTEDHPIYNGKSYISASKLNKNHKLYKYVELINDNGSSKTIFKSDRKPKTNNIRNVIGGRINRNIKKGEECKIEMVCVDKIQEVFRLENDKIKKNNKFCSKRNKWKRISNNSLYDSNTLNINGILFNTPSEWNKEENIYRNIKQIKSIGTCGMVYGRRWDMQLETSLFTNTYTRVFNGRTYYNERIFSDEMEYNCENTRRQKMPKILFNNGCIRTSKILQNNISLYSSNNEIQNIQIEMSRMQKTFFPKESREIMLKRMRLQTQQKISINMDEKLQEEKKEYVYNIEVEDNNNYFVNGFLVHNCDEFAFNKYPQEVLSAVEFMSSEGGSVSILSTPFGKLNLFYQIFSDVENFSNYHRHRITLFDNMGSFDVKESLFEYVRKTGAKLTCPWLSLDFLENKRKSDAPFQYVNFLEEAVGIASDERTAIITETMINNYSMDEYLVEYRPYDNLGNMDKSKDYVISIDFGADNNVTAIVVCEIKDGRFVVCYTDTFNGDFNEQSGRIKNIVKRYMPSHIIGDETGMGGRNWMTIIENEMIDSCVVGVNYSKKDFADQYGVDMNNKSFFITTSIRLMTDGAMIVPKNHVRLREELLGLQKIVYEKTIKYSGKEGPARGDDLAMAFLQLSLLYNRIFEYGVEEGISSVDNDVFMSRSKPERDTPKISKAVAVEAANVKREVYREPRIVGFEKLI